jgi:hypothetical protein
VPQCFKRLLKEQLSAKALQAILFPADGQKQKLCPPDWGETLASPLHVWTDSA